MYFCLAIVTLLTINTQAVRSFLLIPDDFSLQTALLGSIEHWLAGIIGEQLAATLITGLFWGLIGIIVYFLIRVFGNFSNELGSDLVITRYMHPRGDDTYSPLKALMLRIFFHVVIAACMVLYINFFISQLLPLISDTLSGITAHWNNASYLYAAGKIVVIEMLSLHILVVFVRLLLLRKRVFGLSA